MRAGEHREERTIRSAIRSYLGGLGSPIYFPDDTGPRSVAIGDVDGDGKPDVVASSLFAVSMFLGDGLGGFAPPIDFAEGEGPMAVALGDLDLDGPLDVVASNGTGTVTVLPSLRASSTGVTVRNGSGVNGLHFASTSAPRLGATWTAEIDATGHPGVKATLLLGTMRPIPGVRVPYGEVLIDLASCRMLRSLIVPDPDGIGRYSFPIPDDESLENLAVYTQGAMLGGGAELCNALDLTLGH